MQRTLETAAIIAVALLANAAPATAKNLQASINNSSRLPGGVGLVDTVSVDLNYGADVLGWNVAVDQSAVVNLQSAVATPRVSYRGLGNSPRVTTGLRDLRVSATRTVGLGRGVQLDLLARATLPTGRSHVLFGAGRKEVMLDAGLRKDFNWASVWLGGARRFRAPSLLSSGRDINELYAGVMRPIDEQSSVRLDYLLGQSEVEGGRPTTSLSLGYSRDFDGFGSLELNASTFRDAYVENTQGLLSVRVPTKTIF